MGYTLNTRIPNMVGKRKKKIVRPVRVPFQVFISDSSILFLKRGRIKKRESHTCWLSLFTSQIYFIPATASTMAA
jgi:hypothetical protein